MSASNRSLSARESSNRRWSQASDGERKAATKAAQDAIDARLLRVIDPDGTMAAEERSRRLASARSAYFAGLARRRRSKALIDDDIAQEILVAAAAIIERSEMAP